MEGDPNIQICEKILSNVNKNFRPTKTKRLSLHIVAFLGLFLFLLGCQTSQTQNTSEIPSMETVKNNVSAGNFLAARQASYLSDIETSANFYLTTLDKDELNPTLLRQSFITHYHNGSIDLAAALARQLESLIIKVPYTVEPTIAQTITAGDWGAVIVLSDQLAENLNATPIASAIKSWALVATGQGDAGLAHLKKSSRILKQNQNKMPSHFQLQFALMAEYLGYKEEAIKSAKSLANSDDITAKIAMHAAGILSRSNEVKEANKLLDKLPVSFDKARSNPEILEPPKSIKSYIANAIIDASLAYRQPQFSKMIPARLQLALYLDKNIDAAWFFLAQSWSELDRFDRATISLSNIDEDSAWALPKVLLQSEMEINMGNGEAATTNLHKYINKYSDNAYLHKKLGDLYRRQEKFEEARDNYILAVEKGLTTAVLFRNLAISHERLNEDEQAEFYFKKALDINPNDPYTLNYLGYWWAESGLNLDQAIRLIEQAVTLKPNSGFFVDSLGWVHYQLGNYNLAVEFLEKATTLEPEDALIISHLGDAYWQTKRYKEAQFKWRYALRITEDNAMHNDLKAKLKSGMSIRDQ